LTSRDLSVNHLDTAHGGTRIHGVTPGLITMTDADFAPGELLDGSVAIRAARPDDASALAELIASVLEEGGHFGISAGEASRSSAEVQRIIARHTHHPGKLMLVAGRAADIVGMLEFSVDSRRAMSHTGSLSMMIAKSWRRRGIGTALLERALRWAEREPRVEKVCLSVLSGNRGAEALYDKMGFVIEGRRIKARKREDGGYDDEVLMYRWMKG
jgi:RimJ/RimL family protein N-acetyltransferase